MEKIQKTDRRTRYTCQTIKDILLEELKTKPYSKITVTEICKKAEMNRGTFYLHYYDIDDVLNDILEDFLSDTSPCCPNAKSPHVHNHIRFLFWSKLHWKKLSKAACKILSPRQAITKRLLFFRIRWAQ